MRRLDEGGYAVVEASAGALTGTAPAATAGQRHGETRAEPTAEDQPPASPTAE